MSFDMIKKGNTYDKNFVFLKFHGWEKFGRFLEKSI